MRNFFPRVLLGLLLAALVVSFTACRNTGYGDFDYVYPAELGSGIIRGMITRTPGLSIRAAAPVPVAGAEVWLEEFPSLRCLSDAQGNYRIIGVPAGTFRVVAKYNDNVTVYKMRSTSNTLVENDEKVVDLGILTATNIVRGVMTDENGTVLPQGTPVYLWGEVFYIGQNGSFVTPPLPTFEGLNSIFDLVVNPGQSNQFNIPVSFVSADRPLEVVIAVPTSGSTSASAMPTVLLVAMKDNAIRTTASPNEQLTLTGVITPADTSNDNLVWSATRGTFGNDIQTDGGKRIRTWTAPDTDGIATLSLRITAANGKIATASLPILVGANVSYTVTYNGNGNTGGSVPVDGSTYANGANVTVLGNTGNLVKTGFTFAGWNTSADGSGTDRTAASTFAMGGTNVTLYAKWTADLSYTVTYNGNGNTGGSVPVDGSTYANGANVTVLGNTGNLVKTGFTFAGWNTKADGTGTAHAPASQFQMGAANVVLYAVWGAADNTAPTVTAYAPGNGAAVTNGNGKLQLTFSENIEKCTGAGIGNIVIYNAADTVIETIRVDDDQITVSGDIATITPSAFLAAGTSYYVKVDATCFQDPAGNKFAGIADKTTWVFTRPVFLVQPANAGNQEANGIAFDAAGNFYISGFTNGAVNGQALVGTEDYFIAKYSSAGTHQGTVQAGAAGISVGLTAHSLTISGSSLYLAGGTFGSVDGEPYTGNHDSIFFKYSTGLVRSWTKIVAGDGVGNWDGGEGVAVGTNDDVFLAGFVGGNLDGQTNYFAGASHDIYLKKVGTNGDAISTKLLNDAGNGALDTRRNTSAESCGGGCEINAAKDSLYLAGSTTGTFWQTAGKGQHDIVAAKMSAANGAIAWAKSYGGSDAETSSDVLLDSAENVFVLANTKSATDDFSDLPAIGDYDFVLLKLSKDDGSILSKYRFGSANKDTACTMARDADNNIYITGYTEGAITGALTGTLDMFVMRVNPATGNVDWKVQMGKVAVETKGVALAVYGSNVYVCGMTAGGFDGNAPNGNDYFVLRFDKDTGNRN